jgi:putative oxidoreductase
MLQSPQYYGVQRLFSTFPNSWPGVGLLILRLATAYSLASGGHLFVGTGNTATVAERCLIDGVIVLLSIGLWTPIVAFSQAAIQIDRYMLTYPANSSFLVTAVIGISLAMLGPGAWSFDARLFGRRRIV